MKIQRQPLLDIKSRGELEEEADCLSMIPYSTSPHEKLQQGPQGGRKDDTEKGNGGAGLAKWGYDQSH